MAGIQRILRFINCTIESLQGLCYIDNLVMKNCKLINTTLSGVSVFVAFILGFLVIYASNFLMKKRKKET